MVRESFSLGRTHALLLYENTDGRSCSCGIGVRWFVAESGHTDPIAGLRVWASRSFLKLKLFLVLLLTKLG